MILEDSEDFAGTSGHRLVRDDVEADGLGEGSALANSDDVTDVDFEGRRDMAGDVRMALFETVVLLDVVQVVTANDDRTVHAGGHNDAFEDGATDGYVSSEGAFLIDVVSIDRSTRRLEAKADVLVVAGLVLALLSDHARATKGDTSLLLKCFLDLNLSHVC